MKKIVVLIVAAVMQYAGFAQSDYKHIRVSEDIELIPLSENTFVHVSYSELPGYGRISSNGLVFISGNEAFLFDTPATVTQTNELFSWLTASLKLKIVGFVPNHWHGDCMGGLGFLQDQGITSYANQMTIDIAKTKDLPIPDHGFKDSLQL